MSPNRFGLLFVVTLIGSLLVEYLAISCSIRQARHGAGLGLDQNGEVGLVLTSRDGNRGLYLTRMSE
jgi:hypothetical protein